MYSNISLFQTDSIRIIFEKIRLRDLFIMDEKKHITPLLTLTGNIMHSFILENMQMVYLKLCQQNMAIYS